jgi:hypothetical protein
VRGVSESELEANLRAWGDAYGGDRYENIGYPSRSTIATLLEFHGFRPDTQVAKLCIKLDSPADEVEAAVISLQRQGIDGEADAHCLRVAYDPKLGTERDRLRRLHAIGRRVKNDILRSIGRQRLYERVRRARESVRSFCERGRLVAA